MGRVKQNDDVSSFVVEDYQGNQINLKQYLGKKVFLGFYRGTACPFCLGRVKQLIKLYPELHAKGIEVILFIPAKKETILSTSKDVTAPFPIVADPDQKIFEQFGVVNSKLVIMRSMVKPLRMVKYLLNNPFNLRLFVEESKFPLEVMLSEKLKIERALYGKSLGDYLPLNELMNN